MVIDSLRLLKTILFTFTACLEADSAPVSVSITRAQRHPFYRQKCTSAPGLPCFVRTAVLPFHSNEMRARNPLLHNAYRSGVYSCFLDGASCFYGLFCPCCLNASNLAKVRKEHCTIFHCIFCVSPFWTRQLVKEKQGIPLSYDQDCVLTVVCTPCIICQDARELNWETYGNEGSDHA